MVVEHQSPNSHHYASKKNQKERNSETYQPYKQTKKTIVLRQLQKQQRKVFDNLYARLKTKEWKVIYNG